MAPASKRASFTIGLQLVVLSATWLAGIFVNGFVSFLPGETTAMIVLTPAVLLHMILAILSAATSIFTLALVWSLGAWRSTTFAALAMLSIFSAGASGLSFVLGGATSSIDSMLMATAFITAFFLTFLTLAALKVRPVSSNSRGITRRAIIRNSRPSSIICYLALSVSYAVFVSGIYVNLFVAGPVFSLPLGLERAAFTRAENSWPFMLHEALGVTLLVSLILLLVFLLLSGMRGIALISVFPSLFVTYSAYVGSLNLTSSPLAPTAAGLTAVLTPMLSAAAFISSILITMLIALAIRSRGTAR